MKGKFVECPQDNAIHCHEVEWQRVIQVEDESGSIWNYLPLGCEAQMFAIVTCRGGCGRSPHWIGVGTPFGDGKQYLLEYDAWCFWCLPREHFTEEELPLIRQADWARKETKAEIVDFVRTGGKWLRSDPAKLSDVKRRDCYHFRAAFNERNLICTRQLVINAPSVNSATFSHQLHKIVHSVRRF